MATKTKARDPFPDSVDPDQSMFDKYMDVIQSHYRENHFTDGAGLFETCVIIREPCVETSAFAKQWWETMVKSCIRDQIILPYVVWKHAKHVCTVGLRFKWRENPDCHVHLSWPVAPWVVRQDHARAV